MPIKERERENEGVGRSQGGIRKTVLAYFCISFVVRKMLWKHKCISICYAGKVHKTQTDRA